jgi:hypothetical protein
MSKSDRGAPFTNEHGNILYGAIAVAAKEEEARVEREGKWTPQPPIPKAKVEPPIPKAKVEPPIPKAKVEPTITKANEVSKTEKRNQEILSVLLEHPYLHDGLTAEAAFNYLLGRLHVDRRQEKWRSSIRSTSFWMKKQGFKVERKGPFNRYFWEE